MGSISQIAQTNTQLYIQLQSLGYDRKTLALIHNAYECAIVLFNSHYRTSGKPFVCHLVGTASVLASLGLSSEFVIAGLLHAAYATQFPMESRMIRKYILKTFGEKVDELIASYTEFSWDEHSIIHLSQNLNALSDSQKRNVLMRLANEIDIHLYLGMHYSERDFQKIKKLEKLRPLYLDLAKSLNYPLLVTYIKESLAQTLGASPPPDELKRTAELQFDALPLSIILRFFVRPLVKFIRHKVLTQFYGPRPHREVLRDG